VRPAAERIHVSPRKRREESSREFERERETIPDTRGKRECKQRDDTAHRQRKRNGAVSKVECESVRVARHSDDDANIVEREATLRDMCVRESVWVCESVCGCVRVCVGV
jgi:hypothetical protein